MRWHCGSKFSGELSISSLHTVLRMYPFCLTWLYPRHPSVSNVLPGSIFSAMAAFNDMALALGIRTILQRPNLRPCFSIAMKISDCSVPLPFFSMLCELPPIYDSSTWTKPLRRLRSGVTIALRILCKISHAVLYDPKAKTR